ncbi:MAG: lytic transglycosylase domain-containing protein [Acidobacteriota bacterium]|nr:lytic transglycosylase domain-containing protein [Acidobacteriota bacterium]
MKIKLIIAQLMLMTLFVGYVRGQENVRSIRARAMLYEPIIASAAARYNVDPHLLWTIAYLESRFRAEAISYKDGKPCAYGLMQFVAATARRYGLTNPHNAPDAVDAAARYVRDLQERFGGRGDLVLAAYNAGEGTVEAFRDGKRLVLSNGKVINPNAIRTSGVPPYMETREYVARGRIVYQTITREGLFLASTKLSEGWPKREGDSQHGETEASIYTLTSEEQESEQRAKPQKIKGMAQAQSSLYAN